MSRVDVHKTYKLFIGGGFPRSESGRTFDATNDKGDLLANAARASRKDVRDAVVAARKAQPGWAGATAYNRGQVLYRVAEMMESRRAELIGEVERAEGKRGAAKQVDDAIDAMVWYAGLTDKLTQIAGSLNPVAGPYFNITAPEPTGVIAVVAPESSLGFVPRIAAALCGGNAAVVLASEKHPLPAITVGECIATSDVPKGVVNILTGVHDELVPVMAAHGDIDGIDVSGVAPDALADVEIASANNVKRIVRAKSVTSPYEATAFMDLKTVWHPKGR
ncbi:MAG: aldehyde dehydrogenase family protein [Actinomycetota bacterium]